MTQTESPPSDQTSSQSPRRWFRFSLHRFSLRTMMIVVTAIALLLGLWIVPSERQRRFCRSLSELGHNSQFEGEDPEARRHNSWYEHYYRNIASVDHLAYSSERLDQRFAELDWRAVPKLKEIDFGFLCTNEANEIIKNLPTSLQKLRVRESLNDESMLLISRFPELQTIEILSEEVTPSGLDHLAKLKKLRSLSFDSFYSISRAGPNLFHCDH